MARPRARASALNAGGFHSRSLDVFFNSKRARVDGQLVRPLTDFIAGTEQSLDCAIYDLRNPDVVGAVHLTGRHLMHDKFLVRDGRSVWTGSANFTTGGLELQDNNCLVIH